MRLLLLAGTAEASALAAMLQADPRTTLITSFAGRTSTPSLAVSEMRCGGFGGIEGLQRYLIRHAIDAVIDATHPFARTMPGNAHAACAGLGIPHVRVERPPWRASAGDRWRTVPTLEAAAAALGPERRVFLSIGRQEIGLFARHEGIWFLVRSIEKVPPHALPQAEFMQARGPFTKPSERTLFLEHRIELIVTKNSGGQATRAKLLAARELHLPVLMVDRPASPPGRRVATPGAALTWLRR
ncbi:MAG TPA: cobalt-precorrin-6A reductase, partial [Stellaceae bacterium]|nr:cobalt-precorrin-6A reductase [Stellaceae bacterium]